MRGSVPTSEAPASEVVDPTLLDAARALRESLVRVHPSFRFEERVARRLAGRWRVADDPDAAAAEPTPIIPFPVPLAGFEALPAAFADDEPAGPALTGPLPAHRDRLPWGQVPRGALIGGAIASGVSIAGAALLARRWWHRPSRAADTGRGAA